MIDFQKEIEELKIIDSHMHLGLSSQLYCPGYSDKRVIEMLKRYGVKTCLCSHIQSITGIIDDQVEIIRSLGEEFGDYVYWYMIYDPRAAQSSINMIEENRKKINFAGVKIHPVIHQTTLDDPDYYLLWEYAVKNDITILSHTWSPHTDNPKQFYGDPLLLESVLKKFKKLKIILGHAGGKVSFYPKVIDFASNFRNVYLEFAGDTFYPEIFRKAIDVIGSHRILFGTDMPWIDIRYHIINILTASISRKEKINIFYENSIRLFELKI